MQHYRDVNSIQYVSWPMINNSRTNVVIILKRTAYHLLMTCKQLMVLLSLCPTDASSCIKTLTGLQTYKVFRPIKCHGFGVRLGFQPNAMHASCATYARIRTCLNVFLSAFVGCFSVLALRLTGNLAKTQCFTVKTSHCQNVPSSKRPKVITSPVKTSLHGQNVPSQIVPILR